MTTRNDPQQGTMPFSWIPTTLKGATLKGESHILNRGISGNGYAEWTQWTGKKGTQ
jgi:hypothetical protein